MFGNTAVHTALLRADPGTAEKLLLLAPNLVFKVNECNETLLHAAIKAGCPQLAINILHMNWDALHMTNHDNRTGYDLAVAFIGGDSQLAQLMRPKLSFDEIVAGFTKCRKFHGAILIPLVKETVEQPLERSLGQDLARIVGSYVLGWRSFRTTSRPRSPPYLLQKDKERSLNLFFVWGILISEACVCCLC